MAVVRNLLIRVGADYSAARQALQGATREVARFKRDTQKNLDEISGRRGFGQLNSQFRELSRSVSSSLSQMRGANGIGRAIALRRALGLEVPTEYLNAPNPTEVCVGDVVAGAMEHGYYSVDKRFTLTRLRGDGSYNYAESQTDWIETRQIGVILDDSREGADDSAPSAKGAAA